MQLVVDVECRLADCVVRACRLQGHFISCHFAGWDDRKGRPYGRELHNVESEVLVQLPSRLVDAIMRFGFLYRSIGGFDTVLAYVVF